jgi:hypothetical protein
MKSQWRQKKPKRIDDGLDVERVLVLMRVLLGNRRAIWHQIFASEFVAS